MIQYNLLKNENNEINFDEVQHFIQKHKLVDKIDTNNLLPLSNTKIKVLSLFSGCGGLDLGFIGNFYYLNKFYEQNNFEIIFANEINECATKTYQHNIGNHIICDDIKKLTNFPKADIIIGGFPCQDFSLAGKRQGFKVERGRLYLEMKRVIDTIKPKIFIAENVKNLILLEKGIIFKTIIEDFEKSGYNVYFHLFHSANYGIPQNRERVIIYGIRKDLSTLPLIPKEICKKENWVNSKMAIDDLWSMINCGIPNHSTKDYSKAKFYEGKKTQGNMRILPNKIAPTIRAEHHGNIEGHYRTNGNKDDLANWRRLSVRECARLQSFPDNFVFKSSASTSYKQVGNAVPPVLAWYIARALSLSLKDN